ncbi:MAG: hypothetical protein Q9223_000565 [Gallowayella weberi]
MADSQASPSKPIDESPAQRQARLRRERREAKIKAGGSTRLDKITQLSGRSAEEVSPPPPSLVPDSSSADPEEADISSHAYPTQPSSRSSVPTEADIRQLLRSAPPAQGAQPGPNQQQAGGEDDPMMQILQHMMGTMPGAEGGEQGGLPPGLAALLGGGAPVGGPGTAGPGQRGEEEERVDGYLWKILHAILAFLLGIYIAAATTFNGVLSLGPETPRRRGYDETGYRLFWIFATAEVVLQSSRYFLEKGKTSQGGWMGMMKQVLPEPWKTYAGLVARYSGIWTTVVEDAMVVVFVLGCVAWWKGMVS